MQLSAFKTPLELWTCIKMYLQLLDKKDYKHILNKQN